MTRLGKKVRSCKTKRKTVFNSQDAARQFLGESFNPKHRGTKLGIKVHQKGSLRVKAHSSSTLATLRP